MEIYRRKILSNRVITSIDTDGDGQDDAITLAQLTPVNIQFYLKENIDNMGLFTDFVEEVEVIDIDNIWDLDNDGAGDGGISSDLPNLTNPYDDGTISTTGGVLPAYCTDPEAENYFDAYGTYGPPYDPTGNPEGTWVECVGCCNFGTGIVPGGGVSSGNDPILWTGTTTGTVYIVRGYQSQTKQSCWNAWGAQQTLPLDCGGTSEGGDYAVTSQCGYPQALNMAREFCGQSTEDGAAVGEWSLLEYTGESNDSYAGVNETNGPITATGGVSPETTDTAPTKVSDIFSLGPPFGGPEYLSTQKLPQFICWNEMTTPFKTTIANNLDQSTHPTGIYHPGNSHEGIVGSCNNCKLSGTVGSGTGRCVDNTNIINGIPFRWLNYPQSGKGCGSSKLDCYADEYDKGQWASGHQTYYNNQGGNANWDNNVFELQDSNMIICRYIPVWALR